MKKKVYFGADSSRKANIEQICKWTVQQQDFFSHDIYPYIIGTSGVGKTETAKSAIDQINMNNKYKIIPIGYHDKDYSILDICTQIIENSKQNTSDEFNFLYNLYKLSQLDLNNKINFSDDCSNIINTIHIVVRDKLEADHSTTFYITEAYENIKRDKANDKHIEAHITHLIQKYLSKLSDYKIYIIVSEPRIGYSGCTQNNSLINKFIKLLGKDNRDVHIIKEGRFYLKDIDLFEKKNNIYKYIEINALSFNDALLLIQNKIDRLPDNSYRSEDIINKIGTHPKLLSLTCEGLLNKSLEELKPKFLKHLNDIVKQIGLDYVISLIQENQFDQLEMFGMAVRKNSSEEYYIPEYIDSWRNDYQPVHIFISYSHYYKKSVKKIVEKIDEEFKKVKMDIRIYFDEEIKAGEDFIKWMNQKIMISNKALIMYGIEIGDNQNKEIRALQARNSEDVTLIPVVLEECGNEEPKIPPLLNPINRIDLRKHSITDIINAIK